ncbi:ABC transporter ATP-binding protein [Humibacter ginsenosidimutans]|nr:ABC transporter ATP-binding protein [Humibacter ginsenosidimutans]
MTTIDPTPASPARAAGLLWEAARRHPFVLAACVIALAAEAAAGLLVPVGIGLAVDVIAGRGSVGALAGALVVLVTGAVVAGVTASASASLTVRVAEPVVAGLRESAFDSVLGADAAAVERAGSGDVVTRLTADVERLSEAASGTLTAFVSAALSIVAALFGLAVLDWRFALAGLLAVPIQAGTLRWYLRRSGPVYRHARVAESERTQLTLDAVRDSSAIRALRLERRTEASVGAASQSAIGLEAKAVRLSTRFFGRLNAAEFVGLGAICVVGFVLVGSDAVTLGAATTAALFFVRLFDPVNTVLGLFDTMQQAGASLTRLAGLIGMNEATEPARAGSHRPLHSAPAPPPVFAIPNREGHQMAALGVVIDGIAVSYPLRGEVLSGVDLHIRSGERIAVVGASGAGKTTLARLIAGLVKPSSGSIVFTDAAGLRVSSPLVTLLEQRTHVFTGTLAEDLRLVAPWATDEELGAAARAAGVPLGSGAFSEGLASHVGSGTTLTPADAQHIALARLALSRSGLVILDEASADAGSAAARRLEKAMDAVLGGRTALIVAHRLSQAVTADRVALMSDGRIVACSPHERLLVDEPDYAALWDAWRASPPVR